MRRGILLGLTALLVAGLLAGCSDDWVTSPGPVRRVLIVSVPGVTWSDVSAEATPNLGETAKLGDKALLPGMPVEVYIQTGSHSPLAYILKPFTDYFAPAMKE